VLSEGGQFASGIILMAVLGLSIGNFATTFIYRLPRGLKITKSPPYCECERRVKLEVRDNFPFFSWLMARGKCRWCDIRIPALYAMVELSCAVLFVTGLWRFGLGDALILILALGVLLIVQCAIYYTEHRLLPIVVVMAAACGAMYRILLDGTLFGFMHGAILGLAGGVTIWQARRVFAPQKKTLPDDALLLCIAGGCVGKGGLFPLFALSFALWLAMRLPARRNKNLAASAACLSISLAALVLLYNPALFTQVMQLAGLTRP